MVDTPFDVVRVPTINLSQEELDGIEAQILAGALPKDYLARHFDAVDRNVFGHDAKKDRKGNFIEQGIGASINQTRNSVEAYRKFCKGEPEYAETLKRMEAELAECSKRRSSENTSATRARAKRLAGR